MVSEDEIPEDPDEALQFHLIRAELHMMQALNLLDQRGAPRRTVGFRMLISRAHHIVASLYKQEARR